MSIFFVTLFLRVDDIRHFSKFGEIESMPRMLG